LGGINMSTVRSSLDFVRKQLNADRPLIAQEFMTNGVDLFIEKAAQLINVSREGQHSHDLRGHRRCTPALEQWTQAGTTLVPAATRPNFQGHERAS
jgi:hypothetical protein